MYISLFTVEIYVKYTFEFRELFESTMYTLYVFFWVIPWSLNFICRRFGTLFLFYLHRQVGEEGLNF